MNKPTIIEARITDPATKVSLDAVMALVKQGIPFVAVPCVTTEQVDAAVTLGEKHWQEIMSTPHVRQPGACSH
ncbi:hypothetical protein ACLPHM_06070 [Paenalcaligenes sp. Me131]|uniref:hypothetical protein n=1 Tax=Paenalcaligenes sp. Me131 TaxID=3392636 RepID=UPI003D2878CA